MKRSALGQCILFGVFGALLLQLAIDGFFVLITFASNSGEQLAHLTHFTPVALIGGAYAGYIWCIVNRRPTGAWKALWLGMGSTLGSYLFLLTYSILDARYYFPLREGAAFAATTYFLFLLGGCVAASIAALGYTSLRHLRIQRRTP